MWVKLLLLFFTFSFLFKSDQSFNQDLGRHLKLGEIILHSGSVPNVNLFSYTNSSFPFTNTHWLFEVFVYLFNQFFGLQPLLILKVTIILISVLLVLKTIPKQNQILLLPIGFIFLHVLRERTDLRPEIFSFLFTAATLYILEKYLRGSTKLIFLLPVIQLIWINTHIYFFVGLILQAIYLIHLGYHRLLSHSSSGKAKWLSAIFILSALLSLINPHFLSGLLYPLNVNQNYGYTIAENQTMFLLENLQFRNPNFLFVKLSLGIILFSIIIALFSFLSSLRKPDNTNGGMLKNILLAVFGAGLALLNVRSFPYLVFLSLPTTMQNFGSIKLPKAIIYIFSAITIFALIFESFFYLNGEYYKTRDDYHRASISFDEDIKNGMDFVLKNDLPTPIFNNFDIGSYIIYRGYPKYKVFVDGRPEAYPANFFTGIYIPSQSDYINFKEVENLYHFKTIIFSHTDQTPWGKNFVQNVIKDPDWRLIFIDDTLVILTTPEVASQKQLPTVDLAKLNPNTYQFNNHLSYLRLGLFLLSTQNIESGKQFIEKALQLFPEDPIGNQLKGQTPQNIFFW